MIVPPPPTLPRPQFLRVLATSPPCSPGPTGLRGQIARAKEIKAEFLRQEARKGADARKLGEKAATGVIVSLGILEDHDGGEGEKKKS